MIEKIPYTLSANPTNPNTTGSFKIRGCINLMHHLKDHVTNLLTNGAALYKKPI